MTPRFPEPLRHLNVTQIKEGAYNALKGEAHQYLVSGILMRMGFLVGVITVRAGTYDLIVPAYEDFRRDKNKIILLRAQVKTIDKKKRLRFTGGVRAGRDRIYIPGAGEYKYSTEHSDLIIGIDGSTIDLYPVPTRFIDRWGKSVSKTKISLLRNNFDVLLNWNDAFLNALIAKLP